MQIRIGSIQGKASLYAAPKLLAEVLRMQETRYVLELLNITKEFPGVRALDDVTLRVKPGTVHALVGENGAGKSTLMKCLYGIYRPDSGKILVDGKEIILHSPSEALENKISMIHQEHFPEPHLTVMENIWMGRLPTRKLGPVSVIDTKKMEQDTSHILKELKIDSLCPRTYVKNLSVSNIQMLEIVKAVTNQSKIVIMDEPTSSLTSNEVDKLFEIIAQLKSQGVAIIYISHKMDEIRQISDDISILRDGQFRGTWSISDITIDEIISQMVGRDIKHRFPEKVKPENQVVLKVEGLTSANPKSFKDISFELKKGEILGFAGLVGAQRSELMESIFGMRPIQSGKVFKDGKEITIRSPRDAIRRNIAMVTEERKKNGIVGCLSVGENIYLSIFNKLSKCGVLNLKRGTQLAQEKVETLRVKTPNLRTRIETLSGGNQQKAIFARWLLTEPDVLFLDEPTRGIDVNAKHEIYKLISELAQQGKSIVFISSEMPEMIGVASRIIVMCNGRITGEIDASENTNIDQISQIIMTYAIQFS